MTKTVPFILLILLLSACATLITDILDYGSLEVETVTRSGSPVPGTEIALYNDVQVVALGFTGTEENTSLSLSLLSSMGCTMSRHLVT